MNVARIAVASSPGMGEWSAGRSWGLGAFIAAAFFLALAPTLTWLQFHDSIENLNVATALEMRRGGPWLIPTLQGVPRLAKPPLTAWVTAAAIRPSTIAGLSARDPALRAAAYDRLAWDVRWPALLAGCLTLLATYRLGRTLGDDRLGWVAAVVCGTSFLFLRHCRLATTDGQLMLWVTAANACLAGALFGGRPWGGFLGAGAALALVLLSKGPVGLVQSLVPFGLFVALRPVCCPAVELGPWRKLVAPAVAGAAVMVVAGGWWFAWVAAHYPDTGARWLAEVSRVDADDVAPDPWYKHFASLYLFAPWLPWLGVGVALTGRTVVRRARPAPAGLVGLLLLLVPLVVMSFAKDRYQRYLAPLAPAGALVAAYALCEAARRRPRACDPPRAGGPVVWVHWGLLAGLGVGFAAAAASGRAKSFLTEQGAAWYTPVAALLIAGAWLGLAGLGMWGCRRWPGALALATAAVMLGFHALYAHGVGRSPSGRSPLRPVADRVWRDYPDAVLYTARTDRRNVASVSGNELSIHLNRPLYRAESMASLPAAARPQVWYTNRPKRAPDLSTPPPADWTLLARIETGEVKYVFVREAKPR